MNADTTRAQQLFELVVAALQSHERLEAVELEFEGRLKSYWVDVQKNIDHGILLARLEWEKDARSYERTNEHLERENAALAKRCELQKASFVCREALLLARVSKEQAKAQRRARR